MEEKKNNTNWQIYNEAQINEKELFLKLLSDLCKKVEDRPYKFGRPKVKTSTIVFASALKVYSGVSLRRFMTDMRFAVEKGYTEKACSFSSISKYMDEQKLMYTLHDLIGQTAAVFKSVETRFAIDSSGFRITRFTDYFRDKHKADVHNQWVKVHICCGVKSNIITAVDVGLGGHRSGADNPQFVPLAMRTHENGFEIQHMMADKAYISHHNVEYIDSIGGAAYIPFKDNLVKKPAFHMDTAYDRMKRLFMMDNEAFMIRYHQRSNVESTFYMLKSKFGDVIRSNNETAQINEVLLKVLCHNICCLITAVIEFEIPINI